MDTAHSSNQAKANGSAWLGIMAIVFGVFLAAMHGNEMLTHFVYAPDTAAMYDLPVDCEEDELAEEGITLEECNLMGTTVKSVILSSPDWFHDFYIGLSAVGVVMAVLSIIVGIMLVDYRRWIAVPAVMTFGSLLLIDVIAFLAVINTGPLLRAMYLWDILLWALIHLSMTAAALAELQSKQAISDSLDD
mgnify:CR=1 FL=1|tara:strand:+ start:655 stop:1224 length:570 start_codon:yes stop_codon:yes gene_type:complete